MSTTLKRVYSIPLVNDSIATIHQSLSSYSLTRSPYNLGLAIGEKALNLSLPIQDRLAPVIDRADGLANKGLDVVQARYPYPFETPSQDIYRDIKAYPDHAVQVGKKTAHDVAHDIDQRLTPLVNRYESVVARVATKQSGSRSPSETESDASQEAFHHTAQSQVERAYKLTLDLRNQIYTLSSEQLSHHQTLATVVQHITEAVYDLNTQIANSYLNVKGKGVQLKDTTQSQVHQVGHNIVQQLDKIQATAKSLPANIQATLHPIQEHLQGTLTTLTAVLTSDAPVTDKATQMSQVVRNEVQPLVTTALDHLHAYSEASRKYVGLKVEEVEEGAKKVGEKVSNGSAGAKRDRDGGSLPDTDRHSSVDGNGSGHASPGNSDSE